MVHNSNLAGELAFIILTVSINYAILEYNRGQDLVSDKFVPATARSGGTGTTRPAVNGIGCCFSSFLDRFLLFDQATEIRLMHQPPGERFDRALQLQQAEAWGRQFKDDGGYVILARSLAMPVARTRR